MRALSARLQSAREEEGTRIAREIHDELGATLSSLRWDLEDVGEVLAELGEQPQRQALREKIAAMMRLIDTTVNTVRRIASELRPIALDELGLSEALEWQAKRGNRGLPIAWFQRGSGGRRRQEVDVRDEAALPAGRRLRRVA